MDAPLFRLDADDLAAPSVMVTDVAERVVTVKGKKFRVGTKDDAGRLWTSEESPDGVSGRVYYGYYRNHGIAPGPLLDERGEPLRDPSTGALQFDLDEVARVNATRPGRGARSHVTDPSRVRRTELRHALLKLVRADGIRYDPRTRRLDWSGELPGTPAPRRVGQQLSTLREAGALTGGTAEEPRVKLTPAGRKLLTRFDQSQ
jgi:hypothetical protein